MAYASLRIQPLALTSLPSEVLLLVLTHLAIPDLLQLSRTSRSFRSLCLDPLLHAHRLQLASLTITHFLPRRPTRATLCPPQNWIYLTRTNVLSRQISRSLAKIRLSHQLEQRPTPSELILRAILPATCGAGYCSTVAPSLVQRHRALQKAKLRERLGRKLDRRPSVQSLVSMNILPEECVGTKAIAPGILVKRREVMREKVKDGLRAWVVGKGWEVQKRKREEFEHGEKWERRSVKMLVRRFMAVGVGETETKLDATMSHASQKIDGRKPKFGREVEVARRREEKRRCAGCADPTRAHVLGLRRYWEGLIQAAS